MNLKLITVEPSLFLFAVVHEFVADLNTNLYIQKSCRFDRTHEPDLSTKCDDERQGVLFVSGVNVKFSWIPLLLSAVLGMFALPWSDKAGRRRRPVIFMVITALILHSLSGCLHSYFWLWAPTPAAVFSAVVAGIANGPLVMMPACQVYVCDTSNAENRTTRLGYLAAISLTSLIVGKGGSGFILRNFGFFYSYLLCFALSALSLIVGLFLIKDTSVPVENKLPLYRMFTNIGHVLIDNVRVVFHKDLGARRIVISLLLICNASLMFTFYGEFSVLYQYLRYRFGFNEQIYSGYMFYKFSSATLGIVFCSVVLSKYFKLHDGVIGILAGSFDTLAIVTLFLATRAWQVYLTPLMDVFHGTVSTLTVSFMSKYYYANELGRLTAVIGLFRLTIALSSPTYNAIYRSTLDTFPSAFCLLSIVLNVLMLLCFCGAYILSKRIGDRATISKKPDPEDLRNGEVPEYLL